MNSPGKPDNTGLVAGIAMLLMGTFMVVTGHGEHRGGRVDGPLAKFGGVAFIVFGVVLLALHIRAAIGKR